MCPQRTGEESGLELNKMPNEWIQNSDGFTFKTLLKYIFRETEWNWIDYDSKKLK